MTYNKIKLKDLSKFRDGWLLLQVFNLNHRYMAAILVFLIMFAIQYETQHVQAED